MQQGYKIVYEYIDDLNPHLAGTDELPVNVKEKYDLAMTDKNIFVVVTAEALKKDVIEKRGNVRLAFSSNGVDYAHFHDGCDPNFKCDEEFESILKKGQPVIGYYGALAKWFDYDLLKKIDQENKYQVVLLESNMMILMINREQINGKTFIFAGRVHMRSFRIMPPVWMF